MDAERREAETEEHLKLMADKEAVSVTWGGHLPGACVGALPPHRGQRLPGHGYLRSTALTRAVNAAENFQPCLVCSWLAVRCCGVLLTLISTGACRLQAAAPHDPWLLSCC